MKTTPEGLLGLEPNLVRLVPYQPLWIQLFETEKEQLTLFLGDQILDIQHVGSTSIPGCLAKPILDIAVAVENFEQAKSTIVPLELHGYTYKGENGISGRHYFTKGTPLTTHHLHMS